MSDASEKKFERDFVLLLIKLYRDSPELWQVKSQAYNNRTKKQIAYKRMIDALMMFKPDITVEKLKKKINTLRTNFNKDFRAIESAKRSGASTDDIPKPKSWYFEEMLFIKDQIEIEQSDSSETESQLSKAADIEKELPTDCPPKMRKKAITIENSTEELIGLASAYFKKAETESDIAAKSWAFKLRRLSADQITFAEKIINDTLFEAEMGNLTRHSVQFISSFLSSHSPMLKSPCSTPTCGSTTPPPALTLLPRNASQVDIEPVKASMNAHRIECLHSSTVPRQPQSSTAKRDVYSNETPISFKCEPEAEHMN